MRVIAYDSLNKGDDLNVTYELEGETFVASGVFDGMVCRDDGVWCVRLRSSVIGLRATTLMSTRRITGIVRMKAASRT